MIVIDLPWPDKALSPNARVHWRVKATATKLARYDAGWLSASYRPMDGDGPLDVTVTFYPPSARRFDDDNLIARCKAYFDGIADSLCVDDSRFRLVAVRRGDIVRGGNVRIEIAPQVSQEAA